MSFVYLISLPLRIRSGRDIELNNGNVASRILPVKIHEIASDDQLLIENETGVALRAVDFIYREPGVNRPLRPSDNRNDNQSRTDYRNQVNKVANAVRDLVSGLKSDGNKPPENQRK